MTHTEALLLVDYHGWARDRLLAALEPVTADHFTAPLGGSFASLRDTLAHMLFADEIWVARLAGAPRPTRFPAPTSIPDLQTLRDRWVANERRLRAVVDGLDEAGLSGTFAYRLMNGTEGHAIVAEVLQHVVNHGTYHRGQVVTLLRQLGYPPPASLDLIAFTRVRTERR